MDREVLAPLNEWLLQYDKMLVRGCLLKVVLLRTDMPLNSYLNHVNEHALLLCMQQSA